jgi:arginyl-tRNA synthetase
MNTIERELVIEILKFKSYLDLSILNNEPHHLADHVYTIAKKLNAFYENEKILNLEYQKAKQKLFLLRYTLHVLFKGMYALGIDPVEKI